MTEGGSATSASSSPATIRWERSTEVLWRRTSTGVAVLPIGSSAAVTLDGLHASLWDALVRPMTVGGLIDPLAAFLPDDPDTGTRVLSEAIRFLVATGAVRESEEP
ncbi:MAG: hypothetical protein ACRD2C_23170 [Acidimicrobiales bacterium]